MKLTQEQKEKIRRVIIFIGTCLLAFSIGSHLKVYSGTKNPYYLYISILSTVLTIVGAYMLLSPKKERKEDEFELLEDVKLDEEE